MLEEISIRGLGVIEDASLELGPGLTVLTGETGAGKTMVMTGLALLLGGRADAALVRPGQARLVVEGRVVVGPAVAARVAEAGGELDDDVLTLGRTVGADGRSRAQVGGRSAPVALLAELAEQLVAVHGQHDQQHLLRPARQRELLDRHGGTTLAKAATAYRVSHRDWRAVVERLAELTEHGRERAREADGLRLALEEISRLNPQSGEDGTLAAEVSRLTHAEELRAAAGGAHDLLLGDPDSGSDAVTLIAQARRAVEAMAGRDPALDELAGRVAEVSYLVADVTADLASYAAGIDVDPARLTAAADRQAALARLLRKYGDTVDEVLAWASASALRLAELDADTDAGEELRCRETVLRGELAGHASRLSAARRKTAVSLEKAVTAELAALAMARARFRVVVRQTDAEDGLDSDGRRVAFGRDGVDDVEMLLATHPDAPERPIQRAASGGELSRIMLALQVVLAGADPVPTQLFDEVDAGVGGRAAVEVGRRLARLARNAQVIVVTHLPQVAAFADHHVRVERTDAATTVTRLDDAERLRELSRMLAGQEDSAAARAHAEELIAVAVADRG
jgi:DNA repair protein RecN (Recombination protein N)